MVSLLRPAACLLLGLVAAAAAPAPPAPLPAAPPAPSSSGPPVRARSLQPLAAYFSDRDYPSAAVRNHEQGAVAFRLRIGPDGRPTGCSVTSSSGSAILDSTTCRIMVERPRFEPARDPDGKATSDEVAGRIVWRLPDDGSHPRLEAALALWADCIRGEAAKLTPGTLPAAEVAKRVFAPCAALEAALSSSGIQPGTLSELRAQMAPMIEAQVNRTREALAAPDEPAIPTEL